MRRVIFNMTIILLLIFCIKVFTQTNPDLIVFNNANSSLPSDSVISLSIDKFNNKWIGTNAGLIKIIGDDFTNQQNWSLINASYTNVLKADNFGNVWFARGYVSGLIKYDGSNFTTYNSQNSPLPYDIISGISVDLSNNLWILNGMMGVTSGINLVKHDGNNLWEILPGNFGYQTTGDLAGIDSLGYLWTASPSKITRVNTSNNSITEWSSIFLGQYITNVKPDNKGNVWIAGGEAGWGSLVKFNNGNYTFYENIKAVSLTVDELKNIWIGTIQELSLSLILKYDGELWDTVLAIPNSPGPKAMEFDKFGNLWVATGNSGLVVYKKNGVVLPFELTSFTANVSGNDVILNWVTTTEKNNMGFEIQKSVVGKQITEWKVVGFVHGNGTTTEIKSYSFNDNNLLSGVYNYRLKQIDFDGKFEYSNIVEIDLSPISFSLEQNYPNPFNPSTKIRYSIPLSTDYQSVQKTLLKVYDILGQEVATLVNEELSTGEYEVEFDGSLLSSGFYLYELRSGNFVARRKMILVR